MTYTNHCKFKDCRKFLHKNEGGYCKFHIMEADETDHSFKKVVMQEFYSRENGEVYRNWRIEDGEWNKDLTYFKEIPWVTFNN